MDFKNGRKEQAISALKIRVSIKLFLIGAVKEKMGCRGAIFSFKKIWLIGLDNLKGFLKVAVMSKKQGYSENF